MRYAGHLLRKEAITALNGNVDIGNGAIPIYGQVPRDATATQYVVVKTTDGNETDFNKDVYNQNQTIMIEAVDRSRSRQKGFLDANKIINAVSAIIRTRQSGFFDLSADNFSIYKMSVDGFTNVKESYSDHTYFRASAIFQFGVTDELN